MPEATCMITSNYLSFTFTGMGTGENVFFANLSLFDLTHDNIFGIPVIVKKTDPVNFAGRFPF
jgi:hypothetical protein